MVKNRTANHVTPVRPVRCLRVGADFIHRLFKEDRAVDALIAYAITLFSVLYSIWFSNDTTNDFDAIACRTHARTTTQSKKEKSFVVSIQNQWNTKQRIVQLYDFFEYTLG